MIVINNLILTTEEDVDSFMGEMMKLAYKDEIVESTNMFHEFLLESFEADKRLQKMVEEKFSDDFISIVTIPSHDIQDLDSFYFQLVSKSEQKIKKRQEIIYQEFCQICFGHIKPFYSRLVERFDE